MDKKHANFAPTPDPRYNSEPFKMWCQKVMPLVYDESLSYYELLCKVVDYLNKAIADVATIGKDTDELHTAYKQLEDFVNHYFDTLDISSEVNERIDNMIADGTFAELFGVCSTVGNMRNTNFSSGRVVDTLGYYSVGDGGDNKYVVSTRRVNDFSLQGIANTGIYFTPLNLYSATPFTDTVRQTNNRGTEQINILKMGCLKNTKGSDSTLYDCSGILNTLFNYGVAVYIPNGEFSCFAPLYAKEINLTLDENATLMYRGTDTLTYFIGINIHEPDNRFISHSSKITGGMIDSNYNAKYTICANNTQGLLISECKIQHFNREGLYLGSIDLDNIKTYTIETKVDNVIIRNYEQPKNGWGVLAGSYGIFSGGTDNFFSNLIIMNSQKGIYTGSDDKFVNVHFWQQSKDLFADSLGFLVPPNAVCSFTNCTIDNVRRGFVVQGSTNVTDTGTMFLYAPSLFDVDFINNCGGFEYYGFEAYPDELYKTCIFHSFGAQFSLASETLSDGSLKSPTIKLVPDAMYNAIMFGDNFKKYSQRYTFEGYYQTLGMVNAVPFGYDALHNLLNLDGLNDKFKSEPFALQDLTNIGFYTAYSGNVTDYPTNWSGGNIVIEVTGTPYIKAQTVKNNLFTAYRFGNVIDGVMSWGNWRMVWRYPEYTLGSYTVKCPIEINAYNTPNTTSQINGVVPNGAVVTVENWVTTEPFNFGKVTYNDFTGWIDLDFCVKN